MAALIGGCAGAPKSRFPDASAAIGRIRSSLACNRALQIEGKVDYFEGRRRVRGNVAVLSALPEQVRIDAYSPFGINLSTLTSDGDAFALYDLQSKTYWWGPATACNLARFTKVAVPPFVLVQILRGEPPVLVHRPDGAHLRWHSNWFGGGYYEIEIQGNHQSTERIRLQVAEEDWALPWQRQRLRMTDLVVFQGGRTLYEVLASDYAPARTAQPREDPDGLEPPVMPSGPDCTAEVPRRLRFLASDGETDFVLEYKAALHNPPLLATAFQQTVPGGVKTVHAECSQ